MPQLNLKTEWVDHDTIRVSWTDILAHRAGGNGNGFLLAGLAGTIFCMYLSFTSESADGMIGWGLGAIVPMIIAVMMFGGSSRTENRIHFGREVTTHKFREVPTASITRIDYGSMKQLTGRHPGEVDSSVIRIWENDAVAHEVSKNTWDVPTNHRIRDALAQALEQVRDAKKQDDQDREFGQVSDNHGMPDY